MKRSVGSKSVLSEIMLPCQANPNGSVHGGEIMKLMDNCGGVAAMRHAKTNVVTVRVDELLFHEPIRVGQLVICEAQLVFVGKTSMEVKITVKVEEMMEEVPAKVALTAFFTYVAVDPNGKPAQVSRLSVETEEEREAFEKGKQRYLEHKRKRQEERALKSRITTKGCEVRE
jgi:acyl-CoA hydrolase